jgi:hypothetical protein
LRFARRAAWALVPAALLGALWIESRPRSLPEFSEARTRITQEEARAPVPSFSVSENAWVELEARVRLLEERPVATDAPEISALKEELARMRKEWAAIKAARKEEPQGKETPKQRQDGLLVKLYRLEKAARAGAAFPRELDALLTDPELPDALHLRLRSLLNVAEEGVPKKEELEQEFHAAAERYFARARVEPGEGVWRQMRRNLASLVTIRRVDGGGGTAEGLPDDERRIARAGNALEHGKTVAALREAERMSEEAAPYFSEWLRAALLRENTLRHIGAALRELEQEDAPVFGGILSGKSA